MQPLLVRGSPLQKEMSQQGKKVREFLGERAIRKKAYMSRQCHSTARWASLGQRALKGSCGLGFFMATGFVLSVASRC